MYPVASLASSEGQTSLLSLMQLADQIWTLEPLLLKRIQVLYFIDHDIVQGDFLITYEEVKGKSFIIYKLLPLTISSNALGATHKQGGC